MAGGKVLDQPELTKGGHIRSFFVTHSYKFAMKSSANGRQASQTGSVGNDDVRETR